MFKEERYFAKLILTITINGFISKHAPSIPIIDIPAITDPIIIITILAASKLIK